MSVWGSNKDISSRWPPNSRSNSITKGIIIPSNQSRSKELILNCIGNSEDQIRQIGMITHQASDRSRITLTLTQINIIRPGFNIWKLYLEHLTKFTLRSDHWRFHDEICYNWTTYVERVTRLKSYWHCLTSWVALLTNISWYLTATTA